MPDIQLNKSKARKRTSRIFILIMVGWTATMVGLTYFSYLSNYYDALEMAKSDAFSAHRKDIVYRKWASLHGGVYVPITNSTPPNPYLTNIPDRDIETTQGKKLTLVNPEYMTRQVHELGAKDYGLKGHITSLDPIRPENAPDEWERKALTEFQSGLTESSSIEMIGDSKYFRYMEPMVVEESCLKCHAHQGYKFGDFYGGISVSVPWSEIEPFINRHTKIDFGVYGLIWLVGMIGNLGARRTVTAQIHKQETALDAMANSERMLKAVLQAAPIGIGLVKDRVVHWTNDTLQEMNGYTRDEILGCDMRKFYETDLEFERVGAAIYPEIAQNGASRIETSLFCKDGRLADALLCFAALNRNDLSAGVVFAVVDITDSKRMAKQLEQNVLRMERAEIAAKFGNWELDLNTNKVKGSKGALNIYGVQQEEMDLEAVQKFPLPDYRAQLDEALMGLIQNRKSYDIVYKAVRPLDDKIVDIHSIADFNPGTNVIWGVIQDITAQKLAEESVINSEAKYRMLTENMTDVIWSSDLKAQFTYLSPSVKNVLGYEPQELIGRTFFELLTPPTDEKVSETFYEKIESFNKHELVPTVTYEVQIIRKDEIEVWVEIVSNPIIDKAGNLMGFQGVTRDVTESKEAEEALRESENRFRSYVESSPVGIFETDSEGRMVSANKACSLITGYSNEALLKMGVLDFVPPHKMSETTLHFQRLLLSGDESADVEVMTSFGKTIWESVRAIKLAENRFLFYIIDITERKKAEEDLKAATNQTLQLMKSMINGFVIFESVFDEAGEFVDCRYVFTNDAFDRILGVDGKRLIGKTVYEVWPDTEKEWMENFKDVVLSGLGKSFELYHAPLNKYYYCTAYKPWESNDRFCLIFDDVTERKRGQDEVLEMERKLLQSQKLESLGVLSGGIAHDFNNLLAVIIGNIELAQDISFSPSDKERFLERAMTASTRSARLVRQMLDYSGKGAFELSEVNLSELLENNIDMFRMTVPKNINLKVDSSNHDIFVKADKGQIEQVIMNLLINASEALDGRNGAIEIVTGARFFDESLISESLLPEKPHGQDMAFITVRDDGVGMDAETIDRIFDPFFSTKFVGRGLGMSVVHGVVRGHHGAVTIESHPGRGTSITVYLPLLYRTENVLEGSDNAEIGALSAEETSSVTKKFTILVVDDEQEVLDLVVRQLQHLGCKTLSAKNGREALDVFNENPEIDLVILDLIMPEMGGVEAFNRLKELNSDLMIVICSGYNEEKMKDDFKSEFKPTALVTKPYRFAALKDLLELLRSERPTDNGSCLQ